MSTVTLDHLLSRLLLPILCLALCAGCGDDAAGPDDARTGSSLQGTVVAFETGQTAIAHPPLATLGIPGVTVSVGTRSAVTDAAGNFSLADIAVGDQTVTFSRDAATGTYLMRDIEPGETFFLDQVQYSGGQIMTKHTGTWVGTADSHDPQSVSLIAVELVLNASGNSLTGTAAAEPETSLWTMAGTETGFTVDGTLSLVISESGCSADMTFEGTFVADTLSGTFLEVDPPAGCGPAETGTFRVVKQ